MSKRAASKKIPNRLPAAPARMPPRRNVSTTTRLMSTPIMAAVSGSWAAARMPRPSRDLATNRSSATIRITAATTTSTLSVRMSAPPMDASCRFSRIRGKPRISRP